MEKNANQESFITNGTMQNVLSSGDLKIERVSRNNKVSNTSEKIMTVYDKIKSSNSFQTKAVELSDSGDVSPSGQLSDRA